MSRTPVVTSTTTAAREGAATFSNRAPSRRLFLLMVAAVLLSCALASFAAMSRTPWSDEGWFSSPAYNLAHHGFMGTTVLAHDVKLTRIAERTYWIMPLFPLGQALWYKVFPSTLFWTRAYSIVWIPFAAAAFYLLLVFITGDVLLSSVGVCLLTLSFIFIDNSAFARPDVMCMALGVAGLAAYMALRETRYALGLLVGHSFLALSLMMHPNAVFHMAGMTVLMLWFDPRKWYTPAALAAIVLPYAAAFGLWGLYIAQDTEAFRDQMTANGANNGRWTNTLNPVKIVVNEIAMRYMVAFGLVTRGTALLKVVALLAYGASMLAVVCIPRLRKRRGMNLLLLLFIVYFAAMAVFNQKLTYYLVHILPIYIAFLAACVAWIWREQVRWRPVLALAVGMLVAVEAGGIALKSYQRSYLPHLRPMLDFLKQNTRPGDLIVGSASLLYDFGFESGLQDDKRLGVQSGIVPDAIVVDPLYSEEYQAWKKMNDPEIARVEGRLAEYNLAWDRDGYRVYLRRSSGQ